MDLWVEPRPTERQWGSDAPIASGAAAVKAGGAIVAVVADADDDDEALFESAASGSWNPNANDAIARLPFFGGGGRWFWDRD